MADLTAVVSNRSTFQSDSETHSDIEKRVGPHAHHEPRLDAIHEDDAVGYKEYREGLDLEFTEKEVRKSRLTKLED
jgi:hypothetical protein